MMATRRSPPRPRHLRLLDPLQPEDPPRRMTRLGVMLVVLAVVVLIAAVVK